MAIKMFKPTTPSRRHMTVSAFEGIDKKAKPERSLVESQKKHAGRNSYGRITVRHRGGGNKRKYRIIDFKRDKMDMPATVLRLEYDPNRSAFIALVQYEDGEKRYIIAPVGLKAGDTILASAAADIKPGNCLPLANIPVGTIIGSILPLVIGMVLGNLFPFIKNLLVPGSNPAIAVIGFQLGASMSLSSFITGGISGILLGLITLFIVGPITFAFERLCGGNGKAAVACSTIAGTAMTTPVALAEVAPRYAELAPTAYAQIATAVIITAVMAPILTGWVDKKFCHGKEDLSPVGVEAIEEAVATDIDGE